MVDELNNGPQIDGEASEGASEEDLKSVMSDAHFKYFQNLMALQEAACSLTPPAKEIYVAETESVWGETAAGVPIVNTRTISSIDRDKERLRPDGSMEMRQLEASLYNIQNRTLYAVMEGNISGNFSEEHRAALLLRAETGDFAPAPVTEIMEGGLRQIDPRQEQFNLVHSDEGRKMTLHEPVAALLQGVRNGQIDGLSLVAGEYGKQLCDAYWTSVASGTRAAMNAALGQSAAHEKTEQAPLPSHTGNGYGYMLMHDASNTVKLVFSSAESEAKLRQWQGLVVAHNMKHPDHIVHITPDTEALHSYQLHMKNGSEEALNNFMDKLNTALPALTTAPDHMLVSAAKDNHVERSR